MQFVNEFMTSEKQKAGNKASSLHTTGRAPSTEH